MGSLPQGTVSLLFTDIEGSTRLLERLGRETYRQVLDRHRALLEAAVEEAGGVPVDAQGDATLSAFASAGSAVLAAVGAQRSVAAERWPGEAGVRVRMGIHTGEAALAGDAYVGIAVHRGRRVCEAAHGAQVLTSSATAAIVSPDPPPGVELRDLGEVRLAGFDQPERLFQVVADGLADGHEPPRAQPLWRDDHPLLLERADELAAVDAALAGARTGSGRFVVVEGPAGIGKTAILTEARARASASGLTLLQARGSELEKAFSFGVVRQLFEAAVAHAGAEERARLLAGAAAQATRLFGAADVAGGENDVFSLLHGLYWLTVNLSDDRPLLLAIDDVQWSDPPSLRWLMYLARRLEGAAVSVIATLRPLDDEQPLLDELLVDPALTVIRPSALSAPAVAELVRQQLGAEADDPFVLACHRATGGNPLLLGELLRTLAAEDVIPAEASVATVERLAPDAVTRSVRVRLGRLPDAAARLARAVAVLGDGAERDHAAALARVERREVAPAAAALARADLLRPEPPFSFVHPLVRNAVYESIAAHERAQAHTEAAELLRELHASDEQVAAQLLRAPPDSVPGAAAVLRQAARRAAAEAGLESVVSYLTRALDESLDDAQRSECLLELAAAEARLGSPSVIAHLRAAAASAQDDRQRGEAALALAAAFYWAGDEEEGVEVAEDALNELSDLDDDLRRRLEAELMVNALRLASGHERARERLTSLEVAPDEGRAARLLISMRAYSMGTGGTGAREEALALARSALAAMPPEELAWNYTAGIYALMWGDALDDALGFLDGALAEVRRRGAVLQFSSLSMTRALIQYTRGALLEAEADGRAALDALPHGRVWFVPHAHSWLAQILVERGAVDEAAELVARVPEQSDPFSRAPVHRARALIAAARGDHRLALEQALLLGDALAAFGHTTAAASSPGWRSMAALAHHGLGDYDQALEWAREEAELARAWGAPRTLGRALRVLGLIVGGDEGLELVREAVGILEGAEARLEHAYAVAALGGALRRANRRAEARDHLRTALELAQRLGATLLVEAAHEELIATGARPRRVVQSGAGALTPSERRIAAMAAEGMSNRDIAQALFVTLRTVEMHLSNAFRKLDISSRTQLSAALAAAATVRVPGDP